MIDAYEIGIELLLQDGVSDGLKLIGRELAEIDRAIAVTSAGLGAITDDRSALRTVTPPAAAATGAVARELEPPATDAQSANVLVTATTARPLVRDDAPAYRSSAQGQSVSPPIAPLTIQAGLQPAQADPTRSPGLPDVSTRNDGQKSASAVSAIIKRPLRAASASPPLAAPRSATGPASSPMVDPAVRAGAAEAGSREPVVSGFTRPSSVERRPPASPILTSSVRTIMPQTDSEARRSNYADRDVGLLMQDQHEERHGHGRAPVLANERRGSQIPIVPPSNDRSVAPQARAPGAVESIRGNVVLDGRLVGQWFSEQMGREAAKPPGGTTFFDPRQAPAWNISGALG